MREDGLWILELTRVFPVGGGGGGVGPTNIRTLRGGLRGQVIWFSS